MCQIGAVRAVVCLEPIIIFVCCFSLLDWETTPQLYFVITIFFKYTGQTLHDSQIYLRNIKIEPTFNLYSWHKMPSFDIFCALQAFYYIEEDVINKIIVVCHNGSHK